VSDADGSVIWDYVNAITLTKDISLADSLTLDTVYEPFVVNRALSYFNECVMAANLMNESPHLPKRLQFLFLLGVLRPRKRFSKWFKHSISDEARVVSEYYGCSLRQAVPLTSLHSSEQLIHMRARLFKGGRS